MLKLSQNHLVLVSGENPAEASQASNRDFVKNRTLVLCDDQDRQGMGNKKESKPKFLPIEPDLGK